MPGNSVKGRRSRTRSETSSVHRNALRAARRKARCSGCFALSASVAKSSEMFEFVSEGSAAIPSRVVERDVGVIPSFLEGLGDRDAIAESAAFGDGGLYERETR